jgi:hypothetical protein
MIEKYDIFLEDYPLKKNKKLKREMMTKFLEIMAIIDMTENQTKRRSEENENLMSLLLT